MGVPAILLLPRIDGDVQQVAEVMVVLLLPPVVPLFALFGGSERFPCSGSGDDHRCSGPPFAERKHELDSEFQGEGERQG